MCYIYISSRSGYLLHVLRLRRYRRPFFYICYFTPASFFFSFFFLAGERLVFLVGLTAMQMWKRWNVPQPRSRWTQQAHPSHSQGTWHHHIWSRGLICRQRVMAGGVGRMGKGHARSRAKVPALCFPWWSSCSRKGPACQRPDCFQIDSLWGVVVCLGERETYIWRAICSGEGFFFNYIFQFSWLIMPFYIPFQVIPVRFFSKMHFPIFQMLLHYFILKNKKREKINSQKAFHKVLCLYIWTWR